MDNNTATLEGDTLLETQFDLVSTTTAAGTLYGIAFTLFCLYIHSLVSRLRDEDRKRQARFMLGYSTIIMLCGLYTLVETTWVAQDAYIKHNSRHGGPYAYVETTLHAPQTIICLACEAIIDTLTSAIQIWRVWVVWSATRYATFVILLPLLCCITFTALDLRTLVLETTLPFTKYIQLDSETGVAEVAIQGATTILCTMLISLYLIFEQWRQRKLISRAQGSSGYMKVVTMLIESYALESVWLLIVAVDSSPGWTFFSETRTYIEIIAFLLVLYRVASGKAYESQRGRSHISSLRWNNCDHATGTATQFGEASCNQCVSVKPDTSGMSVVPGGSMA